jgi:hypothetical protein
MFVVPLGDRENELMNESPPNHKCRNPPIGPTPWNVYVFKSGELHKIGMTGNIRRRLRDLRHSSALPVKHVVHAVVCCGEKARDIERLLHKKYERVRHHGEWFELHEVQVEQITAFLKWTWNDIRRYRRREINNERTTARAKANAERHAQRAYEFSVLRQPPAVAAVGEAQE